MKGQITEEELEKLYLASIEIQRYWRGYSERKKIANMHYKIQMNKKKIAELDPKFWDDAKSNSIIQG